MHARYYRQRLGGKKPSEILRGFVLELGRMASQVDDMQAQSEIRVQVEQMEDLTLAVQEMEAEVEEADSGESVRDALLGVLGPSQTTALSTAQLLNRYFDAVTADEEKQANEIARLEEKVGNLEGIIKNAEEVFQEIIRNGEEAFKGALAMLVVPE